MPIAIEVLTSKHLLRIREIVGFQHPEYCYQCAKCTSGCTSAKVISEYKPHLIVALTKLGYIDELIKSSIIWACSECWKCSEFCPQEVSPVEVVLALKNIACMLGVKPPKAIQEMAKNVIETGYIQNPMNITTKDFELISREDLNLPQLKEPYKPDKWKEKLKLLIGGASNE
ncbi:MAG: hypothetical protein DRJ44_05090 [Thermoprotei archaeon]|nr:MAG: hypothetical protein DRJ44_05090 [Thermoprotei archaeon]